MVDGYVAARLLSYLQALGHDASSVGLVSTMTLPGSALATRAIGVWGHHWPPSRLLVAAAILMTGTGLAFGTSSGFRPLLRIEFVGTLNPSAGDVSVFLPIEHLPLADERNYGCRQRSRSHVAINSHPRFTRRAVCDVAGQATAAAGKSLGRVVGEVCRCRAFCPRILPTGPDRHVARQLFNHAAWRELAEEVRAVVRKVGTIVPPETQYCWCRELMKGVVSLEVV